MSTLLIKNIRTLVSCDSADTVYENVDLYAEDGFIKEIGAKLDRKADKTIDASHMLCYPGLVNTHHHLYQVFSRNLPEVQNMELFDWLKTLYEIWKNLDAEVIRLSSLTGMGELMKHGCTTCFDHHYVFPKDTGDLLGAQFGAADELGIRMYASRGSMDLSVKDGGLPPDSVVQTVDEIMKDSERVIAQYHDRSFGAMHRVALAPCSPFSVSADLLRESAVLARQLGVRLHTHLCETKDEENFMLAREGVRPLEYMERLDRRRRLVRPRHPLQRRGAARPRQDRHGRVPLPHFQHEALLWHRPHPRDAGAWRSRRSRRRRLRLQRRLQSHGGTARRIPAPPPELQQGGPQRL